MAMIRKDGILSIYGKMKLMGKVAGMLGIVGFGAVAAVAQSGPEPGCFNRVYSVQHLKSQPDQVVEAMRLKIYDQGGGRYARMIVLFANQGHVRRNGQGGQVMDQFLLCFDNAGGTPGCAVECDGGSFRITRQDKSGLTFQTDYLMVGETNDCGGVIDLAEIPGRAVKYRLNRVAPQVCDGM